MAKGRWIEVVIQRMGGGEPFRSYYIVAEHDPGKAVQIANDALSLVNEIANPGPEVSEQVIENLGLKPGQIELWMPK